MASVLTTIRVSNFDIGASEARMLLEHLRGGRMEREVYLRPEPIVRGAASGTDEPSRTGEGKEDT
jgi:DNA-binding LacI/PurR family transcriptional regulator